MKTLADRSAFFVTVLAFAGSAAAQDRPPKPFAVEVGPVLGLGVNTSPLGFGPNLGVEAGVRILAGPGFFGIHLRGSYERYSFDGHGTLGCTPANPTMPMGAPASPCITSNGGMYMYNFVEEAVTIGLPISYRFLRDGHAHPYVQVQPILSLMHGVATTYGLTNNETGNWTRGFGILGAVGFQYDVGPGGVWIEAGYRYVVVENRVTAGPDATVSIIAAAVGYRLAF